MPCFFVYKGVNIGFVFRQSSKIFLMLLNNYSINSNKRFLINLLPKNCPTMFYKVSLSQSLYLSITTHLVSYRNMKGH